MQWFGRTSETFGFSAKMLIGGARPSRPRPFRSSTTAGRADLQPVRVHQDFYRLRARGERARPFTEQPAPDRRRRLPVHRERLYGHDYYGYGYPGHLSPSGWTGSVGLQIGGGLTRPGTPFTACIMAFRPSIR